jgi:DNA-binding MarR family transcriptional regulator
MFKYTDTPSDTVDKTPLGIMLSILTSFEVLGRYLEIELMRHGASLNRFHVMSTLYKNNGEMMPSEIGKWVFRANNTITAVVNTLEKQGLVRREPSPEDGRVTKVIITDKGWKEANDLTPIAQQRSREALSCLDNDRIEALVETMREIRNSLLPEITGGTG